ncbi:Protein-L-isoaspartate O-methyltransferase [Maioricimonas rarisocia]|uniref:Protein-L-isoaspartate O-methyltransferase n=1 Tax=Maioricimonas rarisocia TaxID=2528026 RepID=A0A517ZAF9_9PLAN|nr:Protein-L-isoaspartate O-methyltransferase [Maioricimonas rarisocia]
MRPGLTPVFSVRCTCLSLLVLVANLLVPSGTAVAQRRDPFREARLRMVALDIAAEGVRNPRVLEAMRTVPRHLFVRPNLRHLAYLDQALDIGYKQTISPPFIVAYMTEVIDPQPEDRVLEIGTGSGYQAAVLSGLVKEVYTIEIVEQLGRRAASLLERLDYDNVHAKVGDGYQGWAEHAPFDKIIVTCSPEDIPTPLVEQLREGGKMIIPLGQRYQQVFHLLEKRDGKLVETKLLPTLFVPMTGKSEELRNVKPDPTRPQLVNGGFEELLDESGRAVGWHYQRRSRIVDEQAPEGQQYICFENVAPGRSAHMLQGMALDGSAVSAIRLSFWMQLTDVSPGQESYEKPALYLHFFDAQRRPLGQKLIGPWLSDVPQWKQVETMVSIPVRTREMIVQVGLNGATGTLCIDNIALTPITN